MDGLGWSGRSGLRPVLLADFSSEIELGGEFLLLDHAKGLFKDSARLPARRASEALRLHGGLAVGADDRSRPVSCGTSHLDRELDRPARQGLFGDGVAGLADIEARFLDGLGLEEAIHLVLFAPSPTIVVVADLPCRGIDDDRAAPPRLDHQSPPRRRWRVRRGRERVP
jgi:hypothetical protein